MSKFDRFGCLDTDRDGYSDPDGNWTLADGADAYVDDPFTHIFVEPEPKESDEENFFASPLMLIVYGLVVLVLAGLGFMMTRKRDGADVAKQLPNMGMHQPMQQQVVMPAAQQNPYVQPTQTQTYAQAAVAPPTPQPDPAREYYNGLIAQGYPPESAASYTTQYFPGFQA